MKLPALPTAGTRQVFLLALRYLGNEGSCGNSRCGCHIIRSSKLQYPCQWRKMPELLKALKILLIYDGYFLPTGFSAKKITPESQKSTTFVGRDLPTEWMVVLLAWRNRGFLCFDGSILDDQPGSPFDRLFFIPRPPREESVVCPDPLVWTVDAERDPI